MLCYITNILALKQAYTIMLTQGPNTPVRKRCPEHMLELAITDTV